MSNQPGESNFYLKIQPSMKKHVDIFVKIQNFTILQSISSKIRRRLGIIIANLDNRHAF